MIQLVQYVESTRTSPRSSAGRRFRRAGLSAALQPDPAVCIGRQVAPRRQASHGSRACRSVGRELQHRGACISSPGSSRRGLSPAGSRHIRSGTAGESARQQNCTARAGVTLHRGVQAPGIQRGADLRGRGRAIGGAGPTRARGGEPRLAPVETCGQIRQAESRAPWKPALGPAGLVSTRCWPGRMFHVKRGCRGKVHRPATGLYVSRETQRGFWSMPQGSGRPPGETLWTFLRMTCGNLCRNCRWL